jgi:polar amino acid transport system permease protein
MNMPTTSPLPAVQHEADQIGSSEPKLVKNRSSGVRLVACACVALLLIALAWSFATNQRIHWSVVGDYLFSPDILHGVLKTIGLTVYAMSVGIVIGIVLALMRLSDDAFLSGFARSYVTVMRGIPALVQLIFWYNLSAIYPHIGLALPGIGSFTVDANTAITPLTAAVLGLGLCEGAYMAEIVRGGIMSVDNGQREAALALGLSRAQAMRKVILPQALRIIVPPTGNQVIGMMKLTSLASVISFTELLTSAQLVFNRTFEVIPLLIVVSLWYLVLSVILSIGQRHLEQRFGRHKNRTM